jgi:hypothetical protein
MESIDASALRFRTRGFAAKGEIWYIHHSLLGKSDENSRKIVADKAVYTIDKNKELG